MLPTHLIICQNSRLPGFWNVHDFRNRKRTCLLRGLRSLSSDPLLWSENWHGEKENNTNNTIECWNRLVHKVKYIEVDLLLLLYWKLPFSYIYACAKRCDFKPSINLIRCPRRALSSESIQSSTMKISTLCLVAGLSHLAYAHTIFCQLESEGTTYRRNNFF